MSKIIFINYADANYVSKQFELCRIAKESGQFDEIAPYTKASIMANEPFYEKHKSILDEKRGAGFWLWKSAIILDALHNAQENDIIVYVDCGDIFSSEDLPQLREFLLGATKDTPTQDKDFLLTDGAFPNYQYTKRDCFVLMDADEEKYYRAIQVEAGIIVVKNTLRSRCIVEEWMNYCTDRRIVTDDENTCSVNYEGFIDHRHDQSILSILKIKHNLYSSNEMRRFIFCNHNDK